MPARRPSRATQPVVTARRDRFVGQIRLLHVLRTIAVIHHGDPDTVFEGNAREGRFFATNGSGDHHVVAWDANGVAAMAFDHESSDSEANLPPAARKPERLFEEAPEVLRELARGLIDWKASARLGTGAIWIATVDGEVVDGAKGEIEQLEAYDQEPEDVLEAWRRAASISKDHARIAAKLAASAAASQTIDEADGLALLAPPTKKATVPNPRYVGEAVRALATLGIEWPDGVETARRIASADQDHGYALIDACAAGDLEAVRALLAKGANIEKKARPEQFPSSDGGETALTVAAERGHTAIVEALLDAGADPNAPGRFYGPLITAAERNRRDVCALLAARGAELAQGLDVMWRQAQRTGSVDVLELALELGHRPTLNPSGFDELLELLEKTGRQPLLSRLPDLEKLRAARTTWEAETRSQERYAPNRAAAYCLLLHLVQAVRRIHFEVVVTTHYERSRFASSKGERERVVVGWNKDGLVAWGIGASGNIAPAEPRPPSVFLADTSPALRALADALASWEYAPAMAEEARWVDLQAPKVSALKGRYGGTGYTEVWFRQNDRFTDAAIPPPMVAMELEPAAVRALARIAMEWVHGRYDRVTPDDEAILLAPQPRGSAKPRPDGLDYARGAFGELGIRWEASPRG